MCQRLLTPIKAVSALAPKYGFVPCGVCPECRANKKASWAFRLRAEIETLSRKGWHVGFTTLTYRESDVPRIPRYFAKKHYNGNMPMCFNREHVNLLIKHLRNWMYRTYIQPLQEKVEDDEEKKKDCYRKSVAVSRRVGIRLVDKTPALSRSYSLSAYDRLSAVL